MNNQINHIKSISGGNTGITLQTSLLASLILIIIFVNQANNSWLHDNQSWDNLHIVAFNQSTNASSVSTVATSFAEDAVNNYTRVQDKQRHKALTQLQCLALNIYFEARGESEAGQRAVGHVVLNRVTNSRFPRSICAVVRQGGESKRYRCQFSWWCDGRSDKPVNQASWRHAMRISREIMAGNSVDPTRGALWYHAEYVSPYWRTAFLKGPTIGQHIFYTVGT